MLCLKGKHLQMHKVSCKNNPVHTFSVLIFHSVSSVNPESSVLPLKEGLCYHKLLVNLAPSLNQAKSKRFSDNTVDGNSF